jgi:hypothetical protein
MALWHLCEKQAASAAYLSEFLLGALDESSRKSAQLMLEKCEAVSAARAAPPAPVT